MNNVFEKMNEKLVPIAMKISSNRYLTAIKEGFFGVMPIIIVGSIFLLLTSIPINGYEERRRQQSGDCGTLRGYLLYVR